MSASPIAPEPLTVDHLPASGSIVVVLGKLSLGRSFGLAPANRGVVCRGLYQRLRHPIYLGYLITHVGFVIANPGRLELHVLLSRRRGLDAAGDGRGADAARGRSYRAYMAGSAGASSPACSETRPPTLAARRSAGHPSRPGGCRAASSNSLTSGWRSARPGRYPRCTSPCRGRESAGPRAGRRRARRGRIHRPPRDVAGREGVQISVPSIGTPEHRALTRAGIARGDDGRDAAA